MANFANRLARLPFDQNQRAKQDRTTCVSHRSCLSGDSSKNHTENQTPPPGTPYLESPGTLTAGRIEALSLESPRSVWSRSEKRPKANVSARRTAATCLPCLVAKQDRGKRSSQRNVRFATRDFNDPDALLQRENSPISKHQRAAEVKRTHAGLDKVEAICTNINEEPRAACDPVLILQPESSPISKDQLAAEVKGIYAGLVMVEAKCINIDAAQAADPRARLGPDQWQALIALHKTLLYEHHDFLMATQHPSATPALSRLASKYSMPARMWRHGIHSFLELLRSRRPESQDYMLAFIYLAYQMMALLFETVPTFTDTWIECLGDLARYRMAIEEDKEHHAVWGGVASRWYNFASDRHPETGRLYHHLGILERPSVLKFFLYTKSLTGSVCFPDAKDSHLALCTPIVAQDQRNYYLGDPAEAGILAFMSRIFSPDSDSAGADNRNLPVRLGELRYTSLPFTLSAEGHFSRSPSCLEDGISTASIFQKLEFLIAWLHKRVRTLLNWSRDCMPFMVCSATGFLPTASALPIGQLSSNAVKDTLSNVYDILVPLLPIALISVGLCNAYRVLKSARRPSSEPVLLGITATVSALVWWAICITQEGPDDGKAVAISTWFAIWTNYIVQTYRQLRHQNQYLVISSLVGALTTILVAALASIDPAQASSPKRVVEQAVNCGPFCLTICASVVYWPLRHAERNDSQHEQDSEDDVQLSAFQTSATRPGRRDLFLRGTNSPNSGSNADVGAILENPWYLSR